LSLLMTLLSPWVMSLPAILIATQFICILISSPLTKLCN